LKIHSVSQTPPNFKQRTIPEMVHNVGIKVTSLARILFIFASDRMSVRSTCLLAATRGLGKHSKKKKEDWGQVG